MRLGATNPSGDVVGCHGWPGRRVGTVRPKPPGVAVRQSVQPDVGVSLLKQEEIFVFVFDLV